MGLSIWELLIILVIVALLFGTKKLRSIGGDLGNAVKGFRNAIKDDSEDDRQQNVTNESSSIIEGESESGRKKPENNSGD